MSKTKTENQIELSHLNGCKSARIESGIESFESQFNAATHNNIELITNQAKSDVLKKVIKYQL